MEKEIKCPNCGGNKYSVIDERTVKCLYCGTRFTIEEDKPAYKEEQVQQQNTKPEPEKIYIVQQQPYNNYPPQFTRIHNRSRGVAAALAIILGGIGIHKFYLGRIGQGIIYLLFCWTGIPSIIALIEGIVYLASDEQSFDRKYNY